MTHVSNSCTILKRKRVNLRNADLKHIHDAGFGWPKFYTYYFLLVASTHFMLVICISMFKPRYTLRLSSDAVLHMSRMWMQTRKILCPSLLAFDSAHVKYGVWTGHKIITAVASAMLWLRQSSWKTDDWGNAQGLISVSS